MNKQIEEGRTVVMQLTSSDGSMHAQGLRLFADRRWHSPDGGFLSGFGSWAEPSQIANTIYLNDRNGTLLVTVKGGNFRNFAVGQKGTYIEAINATIGEWRVTAIV